MDTLHRLNRAKLQIASSRLPTRQGRAPSRVAIAAVATALVAVAGCGSDSEGSSGGEGGSSSGQPSGSQSGSSTGSGGAPEDQAAKLCFDTINMHRASIGLSPYERWTDGEACASDQCESDSATNEAHGAFGQCQESAQNECPGWSGPPSEMIKSCLQMMWDEGPGQDFEKHGHFLNMSSQQFTKVACGFYTMPSGSVWAIQNFK